MRSRFRSATEEPPIDELTPPPKRSERPPPLPRCSRINTISRMLVMMSTTASAIVTTVIKSSSESTWKGQYRSVSQFSRVQAIANDSHEIVRIQTGSADQDPVNIHFGHDPGDIAALH